jgi:uncharacterized protein
MIYQCIRRIWTVLFSAAGVTPAEPLHPPGGFSTENLPEMNCPSRGNLAPVRRSLTILTGRSYFPWGKRLILQASPRQLERSPKAMSSRSFSPRFIFAIALFILTLFGGLGAPDAFAAQKTWKPKRAVPAVESVEARIRKLNNVLVGVMSGGMDESYARMVADLASILTDDKTIRVLPILGMDSPTNIRDLPYLRGIDIAIVHADALEIAKKSGEIPTIDAQVSYITRLYNEDMHVLTRNDFTDLRQLAGKKVNLKEADTGSATSSKQVFERLGIPIQALNFSEEEGFEKLSAGEIDAVAIWDPQPIPELADFAPNGRFHLIPVPWDKRLEPFYVPASLEGSAYPKLLGPKDKVATVAVGTVLAVYNWPADTQRYANVSHFIETFFAKFDEFQKPSRHAIWKQVDLTATIPGWTRHEVAQKLLDSRQAAVSVSRADFDRFLTERGTAASGNRDQLFKEFTAWAAQQKKR